MSGTRIKILIQPKCLQTNSFTPILARPSVYVVMVRRALILFALTLPLEAQLAAVPFVGCKSDGQQGPTVAPTGNAVVLPVSADVAQRLAYYKANSGPGVLGPRDWNCFGTYGSSGASLVLSPTAIDAKELFSTGWHGFTGPALQISINDGGTSGRFEVARVIARVFPAHRAFVEQIIAEKFEEPNSFPFGPWPADKLTRKGEDIVEYETPANADGLGTDSRLARNDRSIQGVAIITGPEIGLVHLALRLPEEMQDLASVIIEDTDHQVPKLSDGRHR